MKTTAKTTAKKFDYKSIKSFEDACKHLKLDSKKCLPDVTKLPEDIKKSVVAHAKLIIIYKAINNGWKPDWSNWNQYKYYPWLAVLSSGFGLDGSSFGCDFTASGVGSRLCTDSSDKALYIAEQFKDIYVDFFLYEK